MESASGVSYTLGVMICFDWYFPEAARSLVVQGADVIAHPSNLVRPDCPRSMPIRALENHVYTVTANRYGSETSGDETLTFIGQSEVCDPNGQILVRADRTGDHVGIVDIDPSSARNRHITAHNHVLDDRRTHLYVVE
jgi:predicted amidohydrolase